MLDLTADSAVTGKGQIFAFDYVVIATGSSYSSFAKGSLLSSSERPKKFQVSRLVLLTEKFSASAWRHIICYVTPFTRISKRHDLRRHCCSGYARSYSSSRKHTCGWRWARWGRDHCRNRHGIPRRKNNTGECSSDAAAWHINEVG